MTTEDKLKKSQERYQLAQRAANIGTWDWDITNETIHWSETICPMFGLLPEDFGGTYEAFLQTVHPEDRDMLQDAVDNALKGASYDIEHRIVWPNGEVRWMSENAEVFFDEDGTPVRMLGIVRDITDRKETEDELRHYQHIVDATSDLLIIVGKDYRYLAANEAYLKEFSVRREDIIGRPVQDIVGKELFESSIKPLIDRSMAGEDVVAKEWRTLPISGKCYCDIRIHPYRTKDNEISGTIISLRDITQIIEQESDLSESEERFRALADIVPVGIFQTDANGDCTYVNKYWCGLAGFTPEKAMGEGWSEAIHPDDRAEVLTKWYESAKSKKTYKHTNRFQKTNGDVSWGSVEAVPLFDSNNNITGHIGIINNITELVDAQHALQESERVFRQMAENIDNVVWVLDFKPDQVIYVNPIFEDFWGISREEVYSDPHCWLRSVHPDEVERVKQGYLEWREGTTDIFDMKYHVINQRGEIRYVHARGALIGEQPNGAMRTCGLVYDITEHTRQEEQRLNHERKQRDRLIQEVHHRIKNNLQGIVGLLRNKANKYPQMEEVINLAIGKVQYIALVYGMKSNNAESDLILCDIVPAICKTIEELLDHKINIALNLEVIRPVIITEDESVPIALIIGELIHNAAKHSLQHADQTPVSVELETTMKPGALIRIRNHGARLPDNFDFENGNGLNSGLDIVKSLLPSSGAGLSIAQKGESVEAVLKLSAPVLLSPKDFKSSATTKQRPASDSV